WKVIEAWAEHVKLLIVAGDPWQAIYQFMGAEPALLRERPSDQFRTIGDSHRLDAASADYARTILAQAGYQHDDWLGTWQGIGTGEPRDGSIFYLARTGRLVS